MKIGRLECSNEQLAIAVASLVAVMFAYAVVYRPVMNAVAAKSRSCIALEKQVREARAVIAAAGAITDEKALLTERDASAAIGELAAHGKAMKVSFESIRPRELKKDPASGLKILPVDITVEGIDKDMVAFLGSLDDLKRHLITVNGFEIVPEKNDPSRLRATMSISLYLVPADKPRVK